MKADKVLENFMKEFFPYQAMRKSGFFTKEMKGNYPAQAKRVCDFFGFKTVYEYGAIEIRCHVSYVGDRPMFVDSDGELKEEPFITEIKSIYT